MIFAQHLETEFCNLQLFLSRWVTDIHQLQFVYSNVLLTSYHQRSWIIRHLRFRMELKKFGTYNYNIIDWCLLHYATSEHFILEEMDCCALLGLWEIPTSLPVKWESYAQINHCQKAYRIWWGFSPRFFYVHSFQQRRVNK